MKDYHAFLLRLQRGHQDLHWRVTLENAHTKEVLNFGSERELFDFIEKLCASNPPSDPGSLNDRFISGR